MDYNYYNYQHGGPSPNYYWPQYYPNGQNSSWQPNSANQSANQSTSQTANYTASTVPTEPSFQTDFGWNNQHYAGFAPNSIGVQHSLPQGVSNRTHNTTTTAPAPKRQRAVYTRRQLDVLESVYAQDRYISESNRKRLANELNVAAEQVRVWFQNRRAREKRRQR